MFGGDRGRGWNMDPMAQVVNDENLERLGTDCGNEHLQYLKHFCAGLVDLEIFRLRLSISHQDKWIITKEMN